MLPAATLQISLNQGGKKGSSVFQYSLTAKDGSGSGFGSKKTVPAVPVLLSVSGKAVPTVPVSGSSSVPQPPCLTQLEMLHLPASGMCRML